MNIRNLLTGAAAAIAITIGGAAIEPAPAQANGTCYFETSRQDVGAGRDYPCTTREYRNANGNPVTQVTWGDGVVTRYVFWPRGRVEIFSAGSRHLGSWYNGQLFRAQDHISRWGVVIIHDSQAVTVITHAFVTR